MSNAHKRTRRDHATETAEDYVEAVAEIIAKNGECRVVDLAEFFGVSHVTVTRIVARLVGEELLATKPYRPITLTSAGKRLATKSRKRHEIVYAFLLALGVGEETAALDAEGIEHHVSPATLRRLEQLTESMRDESRV
ncbi:MAG: transcriptional regulator MntR [Planctomycetaceae bacterium]|nr:transcriptional regulator MntR [Planctomycetaceae bacterium]